ncbi:tyrosine-type recombinase/integrase [Aquimarina sp. RZ0]|nr:tyrosine-type recombinase/integrase [Aquimarina sp. RZ0]
MDSGNGTEQVLEYLQFCKHQHKTPSESFFKHTVYGLRALYKLKRMSDKHISLPHIEGSKKLPVVLSQSEIKSFITTPKLLKHRLILSLLYDCGLRRFELLNLQVSDLDFDRKMLHIRQGKGRKDRYVPLGDLVIKGLKIYLETDKPSVWLFTGNDRSGKTVPFSKGGVQWVIKQARKQSGINKQITWHTLRHSYATHLLEMGLDIVSLKEVLGHSCIKTTMMYLHISRLGRQQSFSPLDRVYRYKGTN